MAIVPEERLISVLMKYNPWWSKQFSTDKPMRRAAFSRLLRWMTHPPSDRALLVTGARRIGKTTLMYQVIEELIRTGIPPRRILYISLDNPFLKLTPIDDLLHLFRRLNAITDDDTTYVFLDEVQYIPDWASWLKTYVDLEGSRTRIMGSGSTLGLQRGQTESGVGRWTVLKLSTLSFYEYLLIKKIEDPISIRFSNIRDLLEGDYSTLEYIRHELDVLEAPFQDFLLRGGFPELIQVPLLADAQRLLREDIVSRVLKQDLTAVYGARNVLDIERVFLFLSMHPGAVVSPKATANSLDISPASFGHFLQYLEDANLTYRLRPMKRDGLPPKRGNFKYYLADASIHNAMLLEGRSSLNDPTWLGQLIETVVFKHIFTWTYNALPEFGYWLDRKQGKEVDIIVRFPEGKVVPFEVKYRNQLRPKDLQSLGTFIQDSPAEYGYLITRASHTFGEMPQEGIRSIPAHAFCYLLGKLETSPVQ